MTLVCFRFWYLNVVNSELLKPNLFPFTIPILTLELNSIPSSKHLLKERFVQHFVFLSHLPINTLLVFLLKIDVDSLFWYWFIQLSTQYWQQSYEELNGIILVSDFKNVVFAINYWMNVFRIECISVLPHLFDKGLH